VTTTATLCNASQRLESISRSPVFAHLEESLSGLSSVRAYGAQVRASPAPACAPCVNASSLLLLLLPQRRFETEAHERLDANMVASLKGQLLNRWLGVRLDASGIALVTAVCLASTLSAGSLDPGLVGLMLSYALTVSGSSASGGRSGCGALLLCSTSLSRPALSPLASSQLDGALLLGHGDAAVERRAHPALCARKRRCPPEWCPGVLFTRAAPPLQLPVEKPPIVEGNRPPPDWPAHGAIEITSEAAASVKMRSPS